MDETAARLSEAHDPLVGRVLLDRYRLIRVLGRGGMGVVYLAEHVLIRRMVAIKMLHSQLTASGELVERFQREARAAAAIGNEHIVDVTDMGQLEDGTLFIVLEYLDGVDLAAYVAEHGPLPLPRAAAIVDQICDALGAVHAAGIVHRDLKPENIFLIERNRTPEYVKILDFGICKFLADRPLTATGVALGTPRFMSPEQLEARPEIDHRADIYAVGAILFYALTGHGPFEASSLPRLLVSIWSDPAPRLRSLLPDAPVELDAIVARALEKNAKARFANSAELKAALAPFVSARDSEVSGVAPIRNRDWARQSGIRDSVSFANTRADRSRFGVRWIRRSTVAGLLAAVATTAGWTLSGALATDPPQPVSVETRPHAPAAEDGTVPAPAAPHSTAAAALERELPASALQTSAETAPRRAKISARRQRAPADLQPSASPVFAPAPALDPEPPAPARLVASLPQPSAAARTPPAEVAAAPSEPILPAPRGLKPVF